MWAPPEWQRCLLRWLYLCGSGGVSRVSWIFHRSSLLIYGPMLASVMCFCAEMIQLGFLVSTSLFVSLYAGLCRHFGVLSWAGSGFLIAVDKQSAGLTLASSSGRFRGVVFIGWSCHCVSHRSDVAVSVVSRSLVHRLVAMVCMSVRAIVFIFSTSPCCIICFV